MIINKDKLYDAKPMTPMYRMKLREHGVSHGMSEGGYDVRIKQSVTLHPFKRFVLASTIERFDMPTDMIGIVHDKSSHIRRGLIVGNSVIESGWRGWLTLELFYFGMMPLRIPAGAGIAQVLFHQLAVPASYGDGKYQNQPDEPVRAK
jgi:dCTP deaminase